jgi:hypothetical protein
MARTRKRRLNAGDREFASLVADAACTNPFSDRREELDVQLAGAAPGADRGEVLERVLSMIGELVARLDAQGPFRLADFVAGDREALRYTLLFLVYHRVRMRLDEFIVDQVRASDASTRVTFAREALAMLTERGMVEHEAVRSFAIFYQLRRAFYFIERNLQGISPCMRELRRALWDNVFTYDVRWYEKILVSRMEDFSTLLLGETGTGKGTAAAAIGRSGFIPFDPRTQTFAESFTTSFVPINLSQYPATLIESELFGHRKGAFTGAVDSHDGVFALCSPHGAIFLDEIGEVAEPVQIKLLQVLQERTFSPVGGHNVLRFDGRVIAATNRSLESLRRQRLRDDFFYRLSSDVIVVPPLRARIAEDPRELDLLVDHMLRRMLGREEPELSGFVRTALERHVQPAYAWPGNVRELEQAVRRILLTSSYGSPPTTAAADASGELTARLANGELTADELLDGYCAMLYARLDSYQEVGRVTGLDRRTVRARVARHEGGG